MRWPLNPHWNRLLNALALTAVPYVFWTGQSYALNLANRSVSLSVSNPAAVATHSFSLTPQSTGSVGSIVFQYCSNSPLFGDPCDAPTGLSASAASLSSQSGNIGFSLDSADSTVNKLVLSRTSTPMINTASSYVFNNITNPSSSNQTTFVRISTYASSNGGGSYVDGGAVAFVTVNPFLVGAYVPPYLRFCVGVTVALDCSQANNNSINFGVLSSQAASSASSQYAGSTNSNSGYAVYLQGSTIASGNNVIQALSQPSYSSPGRQQFGINLRRNSLPPVGADPDGGGSAVPVGAYSQPNLFTFNSGDQLSNANNATAYNRMTVSYLINIDKNQPPGVYATTITYLASAQF